MVSKPGGDPSSGISSVDVLIPTERHPASRQREARSGCRTERENLAGDAKGNCGSGRRNGISRSNKETLDNRKPIQGAGGSNREAESTDAPERGALPRSSNEAG